LRYIFCKIYFKVSYVIIALIQEKYNSNNYFEKAKNDYVSEESNSLISTNSEDISKDSKNKSIGNNL